MASQRLHTRNGGKALGRRFNGGDSLARRLLMVASIVKKPPLERRVHRRVELEREVTVELADATFSGRSLNVSVGGMALELACASPRELAIGARVTVRLDLGDGAFALTTGEILRVSRSALGLRFVALDRDSLLALLACVERHSGTKSDAPAREGRGKAELR
jgi:hypothetical protein